MKISTRGRYGLRAMVDLASASKEGGCKNLKSIANSQGLPESYLEQLFMPLKKAGLVESVRGAQGGYRLARAGDNITARQVLEILEGSLYPVECLSHDGSSCASSNCEVCSTKGLWASLYEQTSVFLESVTLADLAEEHRALKDSTK